MQRKARKECRSDRHSEVADMESADEAGQVTMRRNAERLGE